MTLLSCFCNASDVKFRRLSVMLLITKQIRRLKLILVLIKYLFGPYRFLWRYL